MFNEYGWRVLSSETALFVLIDDRLLLAKSLIYIVRRHFFS